MSGVNSKCSRGDLTPPPSKRLKLEDSTLARIGSTEQMKPPTSPMSPVDRVSNFPFELLADILGYFAADCDLEELLNLRLVSSMFDREVYSALKTNLALLPWLVLNDNSMNHVKTALSRTESGNYCVVKSLESYRRIFAPGCGIPIKLMANRWTRKLTSFLHEYSKEIISFFICGKDFHGFPEDLGLIELPALEHAPFSAVCDFYNKEGFVKALAFWKKLVEGSKILKTCQVDIRIRGPDLSPDDQVFDQVEWSRVNSLECSYEFFAKASASNELLGLQKLECESTIALVRIERDRPISLEKVANLAEMKIGPLEWILHHQMKKLKMLTLEDTTITCGQSPSIFLQNLEKIAVRDSEFDFTDRSAFSCLIRGGGVYENVAELELMEHWNRLDLPIRNLAVQICDCFPKLTKLEWESKGGRIGPLWAHPIHNKNAFRAAPVIFSKLDLLTRLKLRVQGVSRGREEREVVELVTGIRLEEIPVEKDSWPTALTGNLRSITNLKHLQSFDLQLALGQISVSERHTNFLFTAAFRTMATLNDLSFQDIIFEDTSCATEWQQLGRTIKMTGTNESSNGDQDSSESSSESESDEEVDDESSGDEWTISDSHSESSGDE